MRHHGRPVTDQLVPARPLRVRGLFPIDRKALIELLLALSPGEWSRPTVCTAWDVRDVALHILGGDLSNLSRRRDGLATETWGPDEDPGAFLARVNDAWVVSGRRLSPRVIIELLMAPGPALFAYFDTLDPDVPGGPVSWAGRGPAPVWLDLAREYMERWVHQQHIRDAVGRPGQTAAQFVRPVIAASMHALPVTMERHAGNARGAVVVEVRGDAGGRWSVLTEGDRWRLFEGAAADPRTRITVAADDWWRLVTLGLGREEAWARAQVDGDADLARAALAAVAIIA